MNKTGVILAGAAIFAACGLFAETQIPLWPDGAMPIGTNKGVVVGKETVSEKGIVQNVSVPAIEVFLPTNTTRSAMGVVICPGRMPWIRRQHVAAQRRLQMGTAAGDLAAAARVRNQGNGRRFVRRPGLRAHRA